LIITFVGGRAHPRTTPAVEVREEFSISKLVAFDVEVAATGIDVVGNFEGESEEELLGIGFAIEETVSRDVGGVILPHLHLDLVLLHVEFVLLHLELVLPRIWISVLVFYRS
jgi:hypothetical protein